VPVTVIAWSPCASHTRSGWMPATVGGGTTVSFTSVVSCSTHTRSGSTLLAVGAGLSISWPHATIPTLATSHMKEPA